MYNSLNRGYTENRARFISVVPSDRTGDNGHRMGAERFPLNRQEHFFTVRVTKH